MRNVKKFIDKYANKNNLTFNKEKFGGVYTELVVNKEKVILLKPMKYINLSGEVVSSFVSYFKILIDDILIINLQIFLDQMLESK